MSAANAGTPAGYVSLGGKDADAGSPRAVASSLVTTTLPSGSRGICAVAGNGADDATNSPWLMRICNGRCCPPPWTLCVTAYTSARRWSATPAALGLGLAWEEDGAVAMVAYLVLGCARG